MTTPYLDAIELPENTTVWKNEHNGTRMGQSFEPDINGTPVIEFVSAPAGFQKIEIACGWLTKATLDLLKVSRDAAAQSEMVLTLPDGRDLDVVWNHADGNPITADPVQELTDYEDADYFDVTLELIRIF